MKQTLQKNMGRRNRRSRRRAQRGSETAQVERQLQLLQNRLPKIEEKFYSFIGS